MYVKYKSVKAVSPNKKKINPDIPENVISYENNMKRAYDFVCANTVLSEIKTGNNSNK